MKTEKKKNKRVGQTKKMLFLKTTRSSNHRLINTSPQDKENKANRLVHDAVINK